MTAAIGSSPICEVLASQSPAVAPRSYRAGKKRPPSERELSDAKVLAALRKLRELDACGLPRPEVLYGRRKMTAWLRRNGFAGLSHHTVELLMRSEGMNGLVRGRKIRTTVPAKDAKQAGGLLNCDFTSPYPNHSWVTDFTYVATWWGFVYVAFAIDLYSRAIVGWQTSTMKGTDLSRHRVEELSAVACALNGRPRKTLGWKTPAEALDEHLLLIQETGVATTP